MHVSTLDRSTSSRCSPGLERNASRRWTRFARIARDPACNRNWQRPENIRHIMLPCTQQPPQENQLAEVISVVVRDQSASRRMFCPVPCGILAYRSVFGSSTSFCIVVSGPLDCRDAFFPRRIAWRLLGFGPITFRPCRRNMFRIAAEFQNVPLRNPQMFEQVATPCAARLRV